MRYHGGKWKIAPWIVSYFPTHDVYVESFGGGGSVLLRKPISRAEVYNDIDDEIVNVFRVIRDPEKSIRLSELCDLTPYSRSELTLANEYIIDPVERARRTLFRSWASFGPAGTTRGNSGFRNYTRPDAVYTPVTRSWNRIPKSIKHFTDRFKKVVIENRPAIDVMIQHDTYNTLHYLDPPYLPETRSLDSNRYYRYEMTTEQHIDLIKVVKCLHGAVVISGYQSDLYCNAFHDWKMIQCSTSGSSRYGSMKRTECIWIKPGTETGQIPLFE